jgi:hypothetical protein
MTIEFLHPTGLRTEEAALAWERCGFSLDDAEDLGSKLADPGGIEQHFPMDDPQRSVLDTHEERNVVERDLGLQHPRNRDVAQNEGRRGQRPDEYLAVIRQRLVHHSFVQVGVRKMLMRDRAQDGAARSANKVEEALLRVLDVDADRKHVEKIPNDALGARHRSAGERPEKSQ